MKGMPCRVLFFVFVIFFLAACGSGEVTNLGDSCTKDADCAKGLLCSRQKCVEPMSDGDIDKDNGELADADGDSETPSEVDGDLDSDDESLTDLDGDADSEWLSEADTDLDSDSESLTEPDGDADTEWLSEADTDLDSDSESLTEPDGDTDIETEPDTELETDGNPSAEAACLATASKCWIAGVCYSYNEPNPLSPDCSYCHGLMDQHGWTNMARNTGCNDQDPCTYEETCDGRGNCVGTAITCEDDDATACGLKRACNGTATCTEWYPDATKACDDSTLCTYNDVCNGHGGCGGTSITCKDADSTTCGLKRACNGTASCAEWFTGSGTSCSAPNAYESACNGMGNCIVANCSHGYWPDAESDSCLQAWTDPESGIMWQNPSAASRLAWLDAVNYCSALSLGDYSDWRLPTIDELRSLIRNCSFTVSNGLCPVTDTCSSGGCWDGPCSGCEVQVSGENYYWPSVMTVGVSSKSFWSSTANSEATKYAWYVSFDGAFIDYVLKNEFNGVRCVRK